MTVPDQFTWLARIRRTQGRKGEVFCEILTDFPEKFAERKLLWLLDDASSKESTPGPPAPAREVQLASHWLHKGGIVLHFAGVDSISVAENLLGLIIAIPRAERTVLGGDEAYVSDLIGCVVIDVAGPGPVIIGEIEDVDRNAGPVPLLVVRGPTDEILIPLAKDYLRKFDPDAKRVEMVLPEGLVDLNGPG